MSQEVVPYSSLTVIGQIANQYASQNIFSEYQSRKSANTLRRQKDDLAAFAEYLAQIGVGISPEDLYSNTDTWNGVTHGLIQGFVIWMLQKGYSIGSINVRISTVKKYCELASLSGSLSIAEYALIRMVKGYKHVEGRNIDKQREITRIGKKKADFVVISREQAEKLKRDQPNTPQGHRDALLMCMLLDHGLRCGELAGLRFQQLTNGMFTFYREKVDKDQTHYLTIDAAQALGRYLDACTPGDQLLLGSKKGGELMGVMGTRAITKRVKVLGERVGLAGLSAHDCRHYWTTAALRGGTDMKSLQDAGGWNSPAMILRYAESAKIANQGVKLG